MRIIKAKPGDRRSFNELIVLNAIPTTTTIRSLREGARGKGVDSASAQFLRDLLAGYGRNVKTRGNKLSARRKK
ncbi:hypothetical protein BH20ACI3_BH20ACI3_41850 [soil metagenome]